MIGKRHVVYLASGPMRHPQRGCRPDLRIAQPLAAGEAVQIVVDHIECQSFFAAGIDELLVMDLRFRGDIFEEGFLVRNAAQLVQKILDSFASPGAA